MIEVILVDENDNEIGTAEKIEAHQKAQLHRAFSIFIFNKQGEFLLQQRALNKYHCGGLWTNTVCSHPMPGETTLDAAHRRLQEEMGFDCDIKEIFSFTYKKAFDNGLTEHEFDHVFLGTYEGPVSPDPEEIAAFKWINKDELQKDMAVHPEKYSYWFQQSYNKVFAHLETSSS